MKNAQPRSRAEDAWVDDPNWNLAIAAHLRDLLLEYLLQVARGRKRGLPIDAIDPVPFGLPARVRERLLDITEARRAESPRRIEADRPTPEDEGVDPPSGTGNRRDASLGNPVVKVSAEVVPEPIAWLSPGRLPAGKLTLLEGDPGLGKSTLLCEWAARVSRGEPLPGGEARPPRGVLRLSAEDGLADTIRPRLDATAPTSRASSPSRRSTTGATCGRRPSRTTYRYSPGSRGRSTPP